MTPPENNRQSGNEHSLLGLVAVGAPQPLYPAALPKLQTSLPFHLSSTTSPTSSIDTHSNISYPSQSTSPGMLQEVKDYVRLPLLPRMDSMSDSMVKTMSLKRVADDIIQQSGRHLGHSPPIQHGEQRSPQTKLPCFAELVEGVKDPSPPATPTHGKVSMAGSPVGSVTQFEKLAWNEGGKRRRLDDTQGGLTYKSARAAMYDPAREEYGSPKSIHPTQPSQPPVTYRHRPSLPAPQLQHLPPVTHARHQSSPGSHAHSSAHVIRPHGCSAPAAYDPATGGVAYGHSSRSYRPSSEPDVHTTSAQSSHSTPASYAYPTSPSHTYPTPASTLYGPASPNPQSPPVPIPYPAPRPDGYAVQHATPYAPAPASNYPLPGHYASASHHGHQALPTSSIYPPRDSVYSPEMYYHQQGPYSNYQFQNVGLDNQFNRKRRGNLPKEATTILKAWFNAHRDSPYPSEDEKVHLVNMTKLNMNQVSNWFINARRRAPQKEQRNSSTDATNEATGPMPGAISEPLSQS